MEDINENSRLETTGESEHLISSESVNNGNVHVSATLPVPPSATAPKVLFRQYRPMTKF